MEGPCLASCLALTPKSCNRHEERKQRNLHSEAKRDIDVTAPCVQPQRRINHDGLQFLRQVLGLSPVLSNSHGHQSGIRDVLIIAIAFEFSNFSPNTGSVTLGEVGISILDTRDLIHRRTSSKGYEDFITTNHYHTEVDYPEKEPIDFVFGGSIKTSTHELVVLLKRLLYLDSDLSPSSPDSSPLEVRDIILVGHGVSAERNFMKVLGIDLVEAPSILDILDTTSCI